MIQSYNYLWAKKQDNDQYTEMLKILDVTAFKKLVMQGIGHNKAYGCGLLLFKKI